MCNSVTMDKTTAETPRELAAMIGDDNLVWSGRNPFAGWPEGKEWKDPDLCLCTVDVKASLSRAGLRWRRSEQDAMEYLVG